MSPSKVKLSTPSSSTVPKELLENVTGCKVLTYTVEDGSEPGYMTVLYSISAEVIPPGGSAADQETQHYLLKCYPSHPARQFYLKKSNIFYNELSFYSILAKELIQFQTGVVGLAKEKVIPVAIPPYIGGRALNFVGCKPEALEKVYKPLDNFILMVDIKKTWGFHMPDRIKGLSKEQVNLAVTEFANLHALSWVYRNKVEWNLIKKFPFLEIPFEDEDSVHWQTAIENNLNTAVSAMEMGLGKDNHLSIATKAFGEVFFKVSQYFLKQKVEMEADLWKLHRDPPKHFVDASVGEKPWKIIPHGDSWCNNMLFQDNKKTNKAERILLLDFQLVREACPTTDLVYFLYTGTTSEYRKAHLDEALQGYHDRFNEVCALMGVETLPGFNMTSLRRRFHRNKLVGFMMAIFGLPRMLVEKGDEINLEELSQDVSLKDAFSQTFVNTNGGLEYQKRIIDIAKEMYEAGVI